MRLPIPTLRLPKLSLPFLKRRSQTEDDDFPDEGDAPPPDDLEGGGDALDDLDADGLGGDDLGGGDLGDEGRQKKRARIAGIARMAGIVALAVVVIGGTGGLAGWLLVNAEHTESMRELLRPQLTVPILAEGEEPEPNSTAEVEEPAAEETETATAEPEGPQITEPDAPSDGISLAPVDPALLEVKDEAQLPIIAADGRRPWSTYARPFDVDDTRPRIAVLIMNLGLNRLQTDATIQLMPGAVTLSFSPYAENLEQWVDVARRAGHEVFLDLPLEPLDFPRDDPGPSTLLTSLSTADNLNRLEWVLGRVPGYVGVATWMGSQFTTVEDAMMPVLEGLKERGLMLVDSRGSSRSIATELASSIQLPRAFNNRFLDASPSISAIDRALADLEAVARGQRVAIGVARPLPVTIDRVSRWSRALEAKGFVLAPVSAIADRQRLR